MTDKSDWDIDSWKLEDILDRRNDELAQLRAEVAKLKTERDELQAERDAYEIDAERNAAVVHGLEIARKIADDIELMTVDYGIESAIAAEIARRKAL